MFTIREILEATNSKLIKGSLEQKISGVSIDSRTIKPGEMFFAIKGPTFDGHNFVSDAVKKGASCLIISNDIAGFKNLDIPVIKAYDTSKALTKLASYQRRKFNFPFIAVTGSNGKTTTKELIAHCLSSKFNVFKTQGNQNNQFGLSLNLLKLNSNYNACVMEIGSNNFGEIDYLSRLLKPNIGIITNIGPSHLEGFKDIKGVLKEKISLLDNLIEPKIAFLNSDDDLLNSFVKKNIRQRQASLRRGKVFTFGHKNDADFKLKDLKSVGNKLSFKVGGQKFVLNTIAAHNVYNAIAAIAIARIFGFSYKELSLALEKFSWLDGRLKVHILGNIRLIDDSYNANPLSFESALDALENYRIESPPKADPPIFVAEKKVLVMADMLELGNLTKKYHIKLAKKIKDTSVNIFIGIGKNSEDVAGYLKKNSRINTYVAKNTDEINKVLRSNLDSKPTTILVKGSHAFKLENVILHFLPTT